LLSNLREREKMSRTQLLALNQTGKDSDRINGINTNKGEILSIL
jgi:hypothetical protein